MSKGDLFAKGPVRYPSGVGAHEESPRFGESLGALLEADATAIGSLVSIDGVRNLVCDDRL